MSLVKPLNYPKYHRVLPLRITYARSKCETYSWCLWDFQLLAFDDLIWYLISTEINSFLSLNVVNLFTDIRSIHRCSLVSWNILFSSSLRGYRSFAKGHPKCPLTFTKYNKVHRLYASTYQVRKISTISILRLYNIFVFFTSNYDLKWSLTSTRVNSFFLLIWLI